MDDLTRQLVDHGYLVLFVWVFLDQAGLPLPSAPLLVAAGAFAGFGRFDLALVLALTVAASIPGQLLLYEIGRRRGGRVLNAVCRVSLQPDSCVRRTEELFARHGGRSLLFARLVPALETVAPVLAGVFRMRLRYFLVFSIAGTAIWALLFAGLGYLFDAQLERVARVADSLGDGLLVLLLGGLVLYLAVNLVRRRRFLRELDVARIAPEELKQKLDAGERIEIIDLRHAMDFDGDPVVIPGATRIPVEEFDARHYEIPRDREIVLYCT
jgi:membrane protein DedA with SNARE-associated domain